MTKSKLEKKNLMLDCFNANKMLPKIINYIQTCTKPDSRKHFSPPHVPYNHSS